MNVFSFVWGANSRRTGHRAHDSFAAARRPVRGPVRAAAATASGGDIAAAAGPDHCRVREPERRRAGLASGSSAAQRTLRPMPYLHLDLPVVLTAPDRAGLAVRLAHVYADVMETNPERVTIAFRELVENGVVRIGPDGDLEAVIMVNCDVRRGRPPEQRERLGDAVAALLEEALGWERRRTILEFTQHDGDEVWRSTGLGHDWSPAEAAAGDPA
jgi:phenylpyruvate tautomerase PptA (4-oxalocrotonate tautomerase family)